jgi:hypothetical protein
MKFKCPNCGVEDNLEEVWFDSVVTYKINMSGDEPSTDGVDPDINFDSAEPQVMCGNCYYHLEGIKITEDLVPWLEQNAKDKENKDEN